MLPQPIEHGQFGFGPAVVDRGVDQRRAAGGCREEIAVPEVAVEQRRRLGRDELGEAVGDAFEAVAVVR